MERKLVKQGNNALTVTLPHEWIKAKGLVAGDVVSLTPTDASLSIFASKKKFVLAKTLDFSKSNEKEVWHMLQSNYIRGYDRFNITHKNPSLIQRVVETSMTGFILETHTNSKSILQSIVSTPQDSLEAILKRVYFMFYELSEKLVLVQVRKGA